MKYLVSILRPEASQVCLSMSEEAKLNYSLSKTAIIAQYKIMKETYKQIRWSKKEEWKKKNWGTVVHRAKPLYLKWIKGCSRVDVVDLRTLDLLVKMMPKQLVLNFMDRDPKYPRKHWRLQTNT